MRGLHRPDGHIFARRAGTDPSLAPVATGSHLDTQPSGGRFDEGFHEYLESKMGGKSWFTKDMRDRLKLLTPVKVNSLAEIGELAVGQVYEFNGEMRRRGAK